MGALGAWVAANPFTAIGGAMSIGGTLTSASGKGQQGEAAVEQAEQAALNEEVSAEYEARQAEYLANQAQAVSQKEALEQRRVTALVASRALAVAAGSGAGASDPTVVDLLSNIYAEGAYRSALALYEGEEQARSYKVAAEARRLSGESASAAAIAVGRDTAKASETSMMSTLLSGGSSLFGSLGGLF